MASWSGAVQPRLMARVGVFPGGFVFGYGSGEDGNRIVLGGRLEVHQSSAVAEGRIYI